MVEYQFSKLETSVQLRVGPQLFLVACQAIRRIVKWSLCLSYTQEFWVQFPVCLFASADFNKSPGV